MWNTMTDSICSTRTWDHQKSGNMERNMAQNLAVVFVLASALPLVFSISCPREWLNFIKNYFKSKGERSVNRHKMLKYFIFSEHMHLVSIFWSQLLPKKMNSNIQCHSMNYQLKILFLHGPKKVTRFIQLVSGK